MRTSWPANILINIVHMHSPEESIVRLKLWQVNKGFYQATKEVVPQQLKDSQALIDDLKDEMHRFEGNKAAELPKETPKLEAR